MDVTVLPPDRLHLWPTTMFSFNSPTLQNLVWSYVICEPPLILTPLSLLRKLFANWEEEEGILGFLLTLKI